jgi:gas vesicle protein
VSPLALVLIGVAVFVVIGAVGVLVLSDRVSRHQRRRAKENGADRARESDVW